jgi:adenosylcobyric acid synthase
MQMLGAAVHDPLGLEGPPRSVAGLALLDFETTLQGEKHLERVTGTVLGAAMSGYEIHMGASSGPALQRPAVELAARSDGALSSDGRILATYVHGLFEAPEACAALLAWAGLEAPARIDYRALREASIERLADAIAAHVDLGALFERTLHTGAIGRGIGR